MRVGVRILGLAVGAIVALLPTGSAEAASFFKARSGDASIEVHVVHRRITFLELRAQITCTGSQREAIIFSSAAAIDSQGRFRVVDEYAKTEAYRGVLSGTILGGVLQGEYESGDSLQGTSPPEGSPVPITVSRVEGLRFYEQRRAPHIYMWVGKGQVRGLILRVSERCGRPANWYENPFSDPFTTGLKPEATIRVNPSTHRFTYREVMRYPDTSDIWTVTGRVERRRVRGFVSHVRDDRVGREADWVHCQTGNRSSPKVRFEALRG
jgi:hypothetical protein